MVRGSKKGGNSGMGGQDAEGPLLWKTYTRNIPPISGKKVPETSPSVTVSSTKKPLTKSLITPVKPTASPKRPEQPAQLDGRLEQRLRSGQVPLEGTLDLHGMTQAEAHGRLNQYVVNAHGRGKRCLLIITGKGRGTGEGVLRQKLPQWMAMPPLKDIVLKILPAVQSHGGSGAWYVYLKRSRDY
jgi:DNA-nicking Smr family endonuclease